MNRFEFVDELPEGPSGPGRSPLLREFAAALRAQPDRWAKWPSPLTTNSARTMAAAVKRGKYKALPPTEFEATHRKGVLYVRSIGEEGTDA